MSCIFCRIANKETTTVLLYEDGELVAFRDIHPQAPVHILIVPKKHIASLADLKDETAIIGKMARIANALAESEGISKTGYRIAINCGEEGGQTVWHLHMHMLAGRQLSGRLG
ncbi:MAG: histidine triad nucleotide-binding protein [Chloroflexi bacterium]|nr:histidine triad nucleotide-binding protein [Chloroflexota bacterium]